MSFKAIITGLVLLISFASCSKSKEQKPGPAATIEGVWTGKFSVLSDPYNGQFSFRFKAGGILERLDANGTKIGDGTWEFYNDNKSITGKYSVIGGSSFAIIANFDKANSKLTGTWGTGTSDYNGGYWYMNKVQ
ncbi:MAG: hypothetical protein H7Y27_06085 [Gemmatimonadaceae bacterium]|nr:hypothetical protein [Chitinophagaceae bacterium]